MTDIATPFGKARIVLDWPEGVEPTALLALGHGAGGDVDAIDLVAVRDACLSAGVAVARITQPYRVAGRRAPAPATHLDVGWHAAVHWVAREHAVPRELPLIVGGRSSGARVACRTATAVGAAGIVALAFPLHPPGRPDRSRAAELETGLPTLVVNGDRDAFGVPPPGGTVEVRVLPGETHALKRDPGAVGAAVTDWLRRRGWAVTQATGKPA